MDIIDVIGVTILIVMTNITTIAVVTDSKDKVLNKIETPVYIQCYKQTLDHTGMLHRIKCPEEKS